ncbi:MAG: DUF2336 domain-containing protein [Rickettsiales bacterium]
MNISTMDIKKLTQDPSGDVRGMLAGKLANDYRSGSFTEAESSIADDIFRLLLKDVEKQVRKTMAEHLSHCDSVPHDIIAKLAEDEADVASHVLEHSHVLTDDDLIAIIGSTKEVMKLCAIARRENVSEGVSDKLIETKKVSVLGELFKNKTASLSEKGLLSAWGEISENHTLIETLVHRGGLPLTVAEKLYDAVTGEMQHELSRKYKLSIPQAQKVAADTREWEMLGIIPADGQIDPNNDEDVEDLVDQLFMGGRLTHSLLIRALCVGSLSVFEAGIARLAGVPRVNARILLMDSGVLGFQAIYKSASMPEGFADAVHILLNLSMEETDFGYNKQEDFRKKVIERIYKEGHHRNVENMSYLLSIIGGKIAPAPAA